MSRNFDGSGDYLQASTAIVTAYSFTFSGWGRTNDVTNDFQQMFSVTQAGTDNFWRIRWRMDTGRIDFDIEQTMPSRNRRASATTGLPAQDVWAHIAGVAVDDSTHRILVDGANEGTGSGDAVTPKSVDVTEIGQSDDGSAGDKFEGDLGHFAVWDKDIGNAAIRSLAQGISPLRIERANLIAYWPLNGQSPEPSILSGGSAFDMVLNGTPSVNFEPPIPHSIVAPG
jgi:hypothetical protein